MESLKDKYKGQAVNLVGSGPSLEHVKKEHFMNGPVITINRAILSVELLNLDNHVYSMQKDGGEKKKYGRHNSNPACDHSPNCPDICGLMRRPKKATLLVGKEESFNCLPDYQPRIVFHWGDLDLPHNEFSLLVALKLAQYMGCEKFNFISCDIHTHGNCKRYIEGEKSIVDHLYDGQVPVLKKYTEGLDCIWITPIKN